MANKKKVYYRNIFAGSVIEFLSVLKIVEIE